MITFDVVLLITIMDYVQQRVQHMLFCYFSKVTTLKGLEFIQWDAEGYGSTCRCYGVESPVGMLSLRSRKRN
jgi:hypothetical protein